MRFTAITKRRGVCRSCGYDLDGVAFGRPCSECGADTWPRFPALAHVMIWMQTPITNLLYTQIIVTGLAFFASPFAGVFTSSAAGSALVCAGLWLGLSLVQFGLCFLLGSPRYATWNSDRATIALTIGGLVTLVPCLGCVVLSAIAAAYGL